ncbi:MAG: OmpA family protein [Bacteroidota bacterium]|jgi:OOP family OmpA-OmpF porin
MIRLRAGLLFAFCFSVQLLVAQSPKTKNNFFLFQFTTSLYPPSESGLKNPDDKTYSYGFGVNYWKSYRPKIWLTAGYNGVFSNFTPLFVKGDRIGRAAFSSQLDAMIHLHAFSNDNPWNLFVGTGLGIGSFPDKFTLYTPIGTGVSAYFKEGARLFLQAQMRQPLTGGITKPFLHFSIGITQTPPRSEKKKLQSVPETLPVVIKDRDQDGIVDSVDFCPDLAGGIKGCPDKDQDGIVDVEDACPDSMGVAKYKGCPIPDSDGDGFHDEIDSCLNERGTILGCPDKDGDGIADKYDECPDLAGINALRGCPEITVEVKEKVQYAARNIQFKFASDEIIDSSLQSLEQVAKILKENKELKLSIEAHADNRGKPERNMMWSEKRAESVATYFISQGIAKDRLTWKGYGDTKPIANNETEEGRARNRRVEMLIGY